MIKFLYEFGRSFLGAIGIIQNKLDYTHTSWEQFTRKIPAASIGLTSEFNPGFFNGGTRARTASPWDHTFIYVGQTFGDLIRRRYPELLGTRTLSYQGKTYKLPKIPEKSKLHEIVESGPTIEINQLEKYNKDDVALELWSRPITLWEIEKVLFNLYLMVGMPYDVAEILNYLTELVPNPTMQNFGVEINTEKGKYPAAFVCCSTLATYAFHDVEILCRPKNFGELSGDWEHTPPSEIHKYMLWSNKGWTRRLRNCKPGK